MSLKNQMALTKEKNPTITTTSSKAIYVL
jgi:hypothetical protein